MVQGFADGGGVCGWSSVFVGGGIYWDAFGGLGERADGAGGDGESEEGDAGGL